MALTFQIEKHVSDIDSKAWDDLNHSQNPFLSHAFLSALETSQCVGAQSGWSPLPITIYQEDKLIGAMPLYLKDHSYGEYVFDWSWAEAYQRYGLNYYPKLVSAVPFTPATGPRLLLAKNIDESGIIEPLVHFIQSQQASVGFSSLHILFSEKSFSDQLVQHDLLQRRSVQFHWYNQDYENFDAFLGRFNSRKRKNLKKERNELANNHIKCHRLVANEITHADLEHFYRCYQHTYLKRSGHTGYLNFDFFQLLHQNMADNLMLVIASADETRIAAALYVFDSNTLYGRYWGALEEVSQLHFECCYYQGIEFAIERRMKVFNPGTQGEHKIQRGFEPTFCYSNHWLARADFQDAVANFLDQEHSHIDAYHQDACQYLPFKQDT